MKIEGIREAKMYNVEEVAEIMDCHVNTIYKAMRSGDLHAIKPKNTRRWRVIGKYLIKWLEGK